MVQLFDWGWTGDKPLPESIVMKFYDAICRHKLDKNVGLMECIKLG